MSASDRGTGVRPVDETVASQAAGWLARLRSSECTAADRQKFQRWLARDPGHWQAYNEAERTWSCTALLAQDPELQLLADDVLRRAVRRRIAPPHRTRRWLAVAALVLASGSGVFLALSTTTPWRTPPPTVYGTAIGEIRSFTLADHSVVTLDTDTVVEVRMGGERRDLRLLRGKAQFDVAHDAARPFVVHAGEVATTALGTVFQVRRAESRTEVALLEGRVRVQGDTPATRGLVRELRAGQTVSAPAASADWQVGRVDHSVADGWLSGRLVFDAMPLHQVVAESNRYSQRKLSIGDAGIGDIPIDGIFDAGDPDSIALALQYAYPIRLEARGRDLVLRHRPTQGDGRE